MKYMSGKWRARIVRRQEGRTGDCDCDVAMRVCRVHIKIDSDFKCTFYYASANLITGHGTH